jgi:hypothetical protein
MGTSIGGSGGGSSGGGGRGGGGRGAGSVILKDGVLTSDDPAAKAAWGALQSIFSELSSDYISFVLGDEGVAAAYESLHKLHVFLVQERSWDKVTETFGVSDKKGCLEDLVTALSAGTASAPVHPRLHAALKVALEEFMIDVVGDPVIKATGNGATVLAKVKSDVFQSTSARFLGHYLTQVLRHEPRGTSRLARSRLNDFAREKANQVVAAFKQKFYSKKYGSINQVGYSHFFRIMKGEPGWTAGQLRKEIRAAPPVSNAA